MRTRDYAWILTLTLGLAGCATHRHSAVPTTARVEAALGFLDEGTTTRDEIVTRLGPPCGSFEEGKILSYRLNDKYQVVTAQLVADRVTAPWQNASHSLVLLLDERGILSRRALIRVR